MKAPAQCYESIDERPLCASCMHGATTWPRRIEDVQWHDRCGAGWLTTGRTMSRCFSYVGPNAMIITFGAPEEPQSDVAWQDRVDGMRIRKPK